MPEVSPKTPVRVAALAGAAMLAGFAAVVALLGLAEIAFRIAAPPPPRANEAGAPSDAFSWKLPAPYVAFNATPNADVRLGPETGWVRVREAGGEGSTAHIVTDEHGFRTNHDLNKPKADGELRIFLLGGSVAVNGMTNDSTICGVLERLVAAELEASGRRVRCVTAGIQAAVSDQELASLVHHVADHEPDIVISLSGFNDMIARQRLDPRIGYPSTWILQEPIYLGRLDAVTRMRDALAQISTPRLLLSRSRLATTLFPTLQIDDALTMEVIDIAVDAPERPDDDEIVEHLRSVWERMRVFSEAIGAEFFAVLQPCSPKLRNEAASSAFYDRANATVAEAAAQGHHAISLDRLFDDAPELFYDPVHTYDVGNERIANALFEELKRSGSLTRTNAD